METVHVNVRRVASDSLQADLAMARMLAQMLDAQFNIAGIKFGLDAILGLVPVIGDVASLGLGMFPIHVARKHDLGKTVIWRMIGNLAVDFAGGLIPVIGDAADVLIKANLKNLALLEKAVEKKYGRR